jgi:hypothetical protein
MILIGMLRESERETSCDVDVDVDVKVEVDVGMDVGYESRDGYQCGYWFEDQRLGYMLVLICA